MQAWTRITAVLCVSAVAGAAGTSYGTGPEEKVMAVYGVTVPLGQQRNPKSLLNTFPFNQEGVDRIGEAPNVLNGREAPILVQHDNFGNRGPNPLLDSITGYYITRDGSLESDGTTTLSDDNEDTETTTFVPTTDSDGESYTTVASTASSNSSVGSNPTTDSASSTASSAASSAASSTASSAASSAASSDASSSSASASASSSASAGSSSAASSDSSSSSSSSAGSVGTSFAENDYESSNSLQSLASGRPDESGRKCVNKVMMVEETVYEDLLECDHSYDRQCHTSYSTSFEAQQEEECEENYRKNCFINYEKVAFNQTVKICRNPLVKDCEKSGEPICRTEYESECFTAQHEHEVEDDVVECETVQDEKCEDITVGYTTQTKCHKWPRNNCKVAKKIVKKYSPVTSCKKVPRELCAPVGCGFKQGVEICYDKVQTIVQDKPSEECNIEPQRTCKHVTKLVPRLEPTEECVDVPKEICSRSRRNPRKVQKPVIKRWCYVPSLESGLA